MANSRALPGSCDAIASSLALFAALLLLRLFLRGRLENFLVGRNTRRASSSQTVLSPTPFLSVVLGFVLSFGEPPTTPSSCQDNTIRGYPPDDTQGYQRVLRAYKLLLQLLVEKEMNKIIRNKIFPLVEKE